MVVSQCGTHALTTMLTELVCKFRYSQRMWAISGTSGRLLGTVRGRLLGRIPFVGPFHCLLR